MRNPALGIVGASAVVWVIVRLNMFDLAVVSYSSVSLSPGRVLQCSASLCIACREFSHKHGPCLTLRWVLSACVLLFGSAAAFIVKGSGSRSAMFVRRWFCDCLAGSTWVSVAVPHVARQAVLIL